MHLYQTTSNIPTARAHQTTIMLIVIHDHDQTCYFDPATTVIAPTRIKTKTTTITSTTKDTPIVFEVARNGKI